MTTTTSSNLRAKQYWETINADINGVLGGVPATAGFNSVSRIDLQGSRTFLARLGIGVKQDRKPVTSAVDAGAGIGRITQGLLLNIAEHVDVIEPVFKFTEALKKTMGVRHIFNVGLEEWQPIEGVEYDVIWTQWCLPYLTDDQVVRYLKLCKKVLKPSTGLIVVKENLSTGDADVTYDSDNSVTRLDESYQRLFETAGLQIIKTDIQRGFPELPPRRLLPVRMYALKPLI